MPGISPFCRMMEHMSHIPKHDVAVSHELTIKESEPASPKRPGMCLFRAMVEPHAHVNSGKAVDVPIVRPRENPGAPSSPFIVDQPAAVCGRVFHIVRFVRVIPPTSIIAEIDSIVRGSVHVEIQAPVGVMRMIHVVREAFAPHSRQNSSRFTQVPGLVDMVCTDPCVNS